MPHPITPRARAPLPRPRALRLCASAPHARRSRPGAERRRADAPRRARAHAQMRRLLDGNFFAGGPPYGLALREVPGDPAGGGGVEVEAVLPGGTAAESGLLRPGDRLVAAQVPRRPVGGDGA